MPVIKHTGLIDYYDQLDPIYFIIRYLLITAQMHHDIIIIHLLRK